MPLTYYSEEGIGTFAMNDDYWVTDGKYFYVLMVNKGLVKFTAGSDGELAGRVV